MLLNGYIPSMQGLALFVLRASSEVDWNEEEAFFKTFSFELACFYSVRSEYFKHQNEKESNEMIEHVLFPAARKHLHPSKEENFLQLANLHELYKVFERC